MENKKNNGLVVAFIIVLVVAVLGIGGTLYFYNKSLNEKNNVNNNDNNVIDNNETKTENNEKDSKQIEINYDFNELFKNAEKLYTAFTFYNYSMDLDTNKCVDGNKGKKYCLVKDNAFSDYNQLKINLEKIFGLEVTKKLLDTTVYYSEGGWNTLYKEVNGKTYRLLEVPLNTWNGANYYGVNSNLESLIVNNSLVLLKDEITGNEMYDCPEGGCNFSKIFYYVLEKDVNGNWIFNNYKLPMEFIWGDSPQVFTNNN